MKWFLIAAAFIQSVGLAADNQLTEKEKKDGWILLFDGKSLDGWMTTALKPSIIPPEDGCINPHGCGGYMMIHKKQWSDFVLSLDFKMSKGCNSGVFIRLFPMTVKEGWDIGMNGIEVQIDDTKTADYYDTGAIYDLVKPTKNAMKPIGEWNHYVITCNKNLIDVELNGEKVNHMNLDEWTKAGERPDGTHHKFTEQAYKDHPRHGYITLQDHGSPCWYKNIKIKPLNGSATKPAPTDAGK